MIKNILLLFCCFVGLVFKANAQTPDSVLQVVYLLGNTATSNIPENHLAAFQQEIKSQVSPFSIVHLGDILANNGLTDKKDQATGKLDQLLQLTKGSSNGKMYFIPGDKDWDNSGPEGLKNVRRLEKYLQDQGSKSQVLVPGNGCPGPEVIDIGTGLRIIAINTQWWMHPYRKPTEPDTDCGILSKPEFIEALDEAISEAEGRNVLIVGHHPLYSNGVYGGRTSLKNHIFPFTDANPNNYVPLPVLGSLYTAYRQNVGTPRDMANPHYQDFTKQVGQLLKLNNHVIYAAAHDYSLQLTAADENYQLISGSFATREFVGNNRRSVVNEATEGFSKITYYTNGTVISQFYAFGKQGTKEIYKGTLFQSACNPNPVKNIPVNGQVGPCVQPEIPSTNLAVNSVEAGKKTATVTGGPEYAANKFKQLYFGELYRPSWTQPVQVPYLYVSQTEGKLKPYKVGGGRQTTSVRFRAADGKEYNFRSVDKDPVGTLPPELRNTVVTDVVRDIMATEQPYAAMPVSKLLDATDILHARPKLYVLGDDPGLGAYRTKYTGLFGMLEDRPLDPKGSLPGFGGADDIKDTFDFFRQLYKDHDNKIDAKAFAKARAFDVLIGDWGRHPDNWRWAAFKNGNETVFKPIPRDRDHAFSHWNGLLPWIADREWALPNAQDFNAKFSGIRSLTWAARHLDRSLLTSLNRQDWQNIAAELQKNISDPVIEEAIATFPKEVAAGQGADIKRKLKIRRDKLPEAINNYYDLLARYVDVVGSNKNEYFKVTRLPEAKVQVQVFEKDKETNGPEGKPIYDRTFLKSETKEIRLYGLDGKDVFEISGNVPASIRMRIIGGAGKDSILDVSAVKSFRKNTLIYDNTDTKLELSKESQNLTSDAPNINQYSREAFEYNLYNPTGSVLYNKSDGFGISAGINYTRQRFRKPGYGSLYGFNVRATQNGNVQLTSNILWRQAIGKFDIGTFIDAGQYFRYYNFFGLGNNTVKDQDLYNNNYYKARYGGLISQVYIQKTFFQKSYFRLGPAFETFHTNFKQNTLLSDAPANQFNTTSQQLVGAKAEFNLDLRDKPVFTQRGIRIFARHSSYKRLQQNKDYFGLSEGFVDYYGSARIILPITLGVRVGGAQNYGKDLPYFKYASLGMLQNLRGYVINRFSGDATAYLNSELRFHIGQVNNSFLPFRYGLLTFYDRGKVWYNGEATGGWHTGYGGGFYISPVAERFTFSFLLQHSKEENLLFQVGAGFRFDQ